MVFYRPLLGNLFSKKLCFRHPMNLHQDLSGHQAFTAETYVGVPVFIGCHRGTVIGLSAIRYSY